MRFLLSLSFLAFAVTTLARPTAAGTSDIVAIGDSAPGYQRLDAIVESYLIQERAPNAELAVYSQGGLVFSRAYTNPDVAKAQATPATIFRLASNSKAWTCAAITELMAHHAISGNEPVFDYLGVHEPLPAGASIADPRIMKITIQQLVDHKAGWDRDASTFDPMHAMRQIATKTGLGRPVQAADIAHYMLTVPLQHEPGSTYAYCNVCYLLLGMVIEKASGQTYMNYVTENVATPIGVTDLAISPTEDPRLPNEIATYSSRESGLSPLHLESTEPVPGPNGGDGEIREVGQASGGLATSAASMLVLMEKYSVWGLGPPPTNGYRSREGAAEGTNSYARQRRDGTNFVVIVNQRNEAPFKTLAGDIDKALTAISR